MNKVSLPDQKSILIWIVFAVAVIYYSIGYFPVSRFETDSIAIANACQHMINTGEIGENFLGHSYHMQSGTYFLILTISKISGLDTFVTYSLISILASVIAFFMLVSILNILTGITKWQIALVLLLFQEITAIGYYPNSAIIAASLWLSAFYVLLSRHDNKVFWVLSAILLALAAWMRIDIAFTFPSILFLLYIIYKDFWKSFLWSSLISIIVVPTMIFLMWLMHAHVSGFMNYTEGRWVLYRMNNELGLFDLFILRAHLSFFSILISVLIVAGIIQSILTKKWKNILFWFSGILFYYLFGVSNAVAPKHLSYFLLFWGLMALSGIQFIQLLSKKWKIVSYSLFVLLFIMQYLLGIIVEIKSIPYANKSYSILNPSPVFARIADFESPVNGISNLQIILGTGTKIPSADELSASSGILFSPLMWYHQKTIYYEGFRSMSSYINNSSKDTIFFLVTDGSSEFLINILLSNEYNWKADEFNFYAPITKYKFFKGEKIAIVNRFKEFRKNDPASFLKTFEKMKPDEFLAVFIWDWQNFIMREYISGYSEIGPTGYLVRKSSITIQ